MKIEFKKVLNTPKNFKLEKEGLTFSGLLEKASHNLVEIDGILVADVVLNCDRCGKEFVYKFEENLKLFASDGFFSNESEDVIYEFQNGFIDFDELVESEIEAFKSDYHYCDECEQKREVSYEF